MTYEYKAANPNNKAHKDWRKCTEEQKDAIAKQHPHKFQFRAIEKPTPTPSMEKAIQADKAAKKTAPKGKK